MRLITASILLLVASLTTTLAKPIPLANLDEIEARWARGESEVCLDLPGCYIYAWVRSLGRPVISSIHSAHSIRDATPAWPIARDALAEVSWDERSAAERSRKRSAGGVLEKAKVFAANQYRKWGMDEKAKEVMGEEEAPVLKPRRGMKYPFVM